MSKRKRTLTMQKGGKFATTQSKLKKPKIKYITSVAKEPCPNCGNPRKRIVTCEDGRAAWEWIGCDNCQESEEDMIDGGPPCEEVM